MMMRVSPEEFELIDHSASSSPGRTSTWQNQNQRTRDEDEEEGMMWAAGGVARKRTEEDEDEEDEGVMWGEVGKKKTWEEEEEGDRRRRRREIMWATGDEEAMKQTENGEELLKKQDVMPWEEEEEEEALEKKKEEEEKGREEEQSATAGSGSGSMEKVVGVMMVSSEVQKRLSRLRSWTESTSPPTNDDISAYRRMRSMEEGIVLREEETRDDDIEKDEKNSSSWKEATVSRRLFTEEQEEGSREKSMTEDKGKENMKEKEEGEEGLSSWDQEGGEEKKEGDDQEEQIQMTGVVTTVTDDLRVKDLPPPTSATAAWGETQRLVDHISSEKSRSQADTSIDGPWEVHTAYTCSEYFVMAVFGVGCVLKMFLMLPLLLLATFPALLLNYIYYNGLPRETARNQRSSCGWYFHLLVQCLLSFPAALLVLLNLCMDYLLMTLFGSLYVILTCRYSQFCRNRSVIAPYNHGPHVLFHFADIVVAVGGQLHRQGLFELSKSFCMMFIMVPWVKYWLVCNSFVYDLDERFITQIGDSMKDVPLTEIDSTFGQFVSWNTTSDPLNELIDNVGFAAHYPYPPGESSRRYAIGLQNATFFSLFVHTTHFRLPGEQLYSRSKSMILPCYRVMLWHNNPFHIYTGYVEAGVSDGEPSQLDKLNGIEHPMWLIGGHNKLSSARDTFFSHGFIDNFFDKTIPQYNHAVRAIYKGVVYTDIMMSRDNSKGFEQDRAEATGIAAL